MNRERAKELLEAVGDILAHARKLQILIDDFPSWGKIGNYFNFIDGVDEIRAKKKVLELFADESNRANVEDINTVRGWIWTKVGD